MNPLQTNLSKSKRALLAQQLHKARSKTDPRAIGPRPQGQPPSLSFAQQRLWFLDQWNPNSPTYNIPIVLRLIGPLNVAALRQAFNDVVRRHQVLHTTYQSVNGEPTPTLHPEPALTLNLLDLRALPADEQEHHLSHQACQPFNLEQDLPIRVTLLRLSDAEHRLLITIHHIATDGWSMGLLVQELLTLYHAFCAGKPSPLAELPLQYADFAHWQRQYLQGKVLENHLAYWKAQLDGELSLLELPTDRPRSARQTFRGDRISRPLTPSLVDALDALGRQENASLFMVLLAGFQTLLHRYTGQTDVIVGVPIANRNRPEIEKLIGFFVNTLPLRVDLTGNPTFRQLIQRVRQVTLEAYEHQDLPLERIVAALDLERNASHNPLFQTVFVTQNMPTPSLESPDLHISFIKEVNTNTARFDLTLLIYFLEQGPVITVEYNTDLFDEATIERLVGHYQTLLEAIMVNPDSTLAQLPILAEAERRQMLVDWNDTQAARPQGVTVPELLKSRVEQSPDAIALSFRGQKITYQQLDQRANQLANYLRKLGIGPEMGVGICLDRSPHMIVSMLGVLKAGGAYLPLDPEHPPERLDFMLADAQVQVLLTQQKLIEKLIESDVPAVCLDTHWQTIAQESMAPPKNGPSADNLAYIIYTSGSTGQPKGVMITHKALVNHAFGLINRYGLDPNQRLLQAISPSFDASAEEIFPVLLSGATLVLTADSKDILGNSLTQICKQEHITILHLPSSVWHQWVDVLVSDGDVLPASLGVLLVGGEQPSVAKLQTFARLAERPIRFLNAYGPTEATITSTLFETLCTAEATAGLAKIPIGRPIANTQIYLLDANQRLSPPGVPAELCIGGAGLSRGYLNQPALSAEKFIPNPFSQQPGARLYRSGDLARYLPDGTIEFLGRMDHQVKIRGFRVELEEIESVLGQHPDIKETLVLAQEDSLGKRLAAYVVPRNRGALSSKNLLCFLQDKLPDYMLPSTFTTLEKLPLAPNGKVDLQALPAPAAVDSELRETYVAPRNPIEKTLAHIWAQVLNLDRVGAHDSFFALGGHSLLATQIMSRAQRAFQVELTLQDFFIKPTVEAMARTIAQKSQSPLKETEIKRVRRPDAKRLLSKLDQLSDEQISALLDDRLTKRE